MIQSPLICFSFGPFMFQFWSVLPRSVSLRSVGPRTVSPQALYDRHEATRHHVHLFFVCVMSIGTCYNHSILSCQNTKLDDTQDNACDHSIDGGCQTDCGPPVKFQGQKTM
jgi:hypothetical protein